MSVGIFAGFVILVGVYLFINDPTVGTPTEFIKKKAIESVVDDSKLTPYQQELLESGDTGALVKDLQENVTLQIR